MQNTRIVPEAPERTRDMGAEHSPSRPPYTTDAAQCARQLHDLERFFGTAGLEKAIEAWQTNADVQARLHFLHQIEDDQQVLDAINRMRRLGNNGLADEIKANWKATPRPAATPFPGLAVV